MANPRTHTAAAGRRPAAILALLALCVGLVAAIGITSAAARKATLIGKTKHAPGPSCGDKTHPKDCSVVGRVTGYMTVADGEKHPFKVAKDGKVVAWSMDLGKPIEKKYGQRTFFGTLFGNDKFGHAATARLAIIRRKGKHRFKLKRQSKTVELGGELGRKEIFTLDKPLRVHKGDVVALTYPTWAPNFISSDIDSSVSVQGNQWRASRVDKHCAPKHNTDSSKKRFARKSHPQKKVGSTRPYECNYSGGRLLYWAYFVPSKKS